jgi:septum formation protein
MADTGESPNVPLDSCAAGTALDAHLERERAEAAACLGRSQFDLVLASASPRRRQLLRPLFPNLEVLAAEVAEIPRADETPHVFAARVARDKAESIATRRPHRWILGADTVVTIDGEILGKPKDGDDAARMLQTLSGRTHRVCTAIAVAGPAAEVCVVETRVTFRAVTPDEIGAYIGSGEPFDKAGAYAIQSGGGSFVTGVSGSYSNVIGLPLVDVARLLVRLRDAAE